MCFVFYLPVFTLEFSPRNKIARRMMQNVNYSELTKLRKAYKTQCEKLEVFVYCLFNDTFRRVADCILS
jgi:RimJ/RimL family protein N-acetyltransferase